MCAMSADALPLALLFSASSLALGAVAAHFSRSKSRPHGAPLLSRTALLALLEASARNAEDARVRTGSGGRARGELWRPNETSQIEPGSAVAMSDTEGADNDANAPRRSRERTHAACGHARTLLTT